MLPLSALSPQTLIGLLTVSVLGLTILLALTWLLLRQESRLLRRATRKVLILTRTTVGLRKGWRDALSAYHQIRRRQLGWGDSLLKTQQAETKREVPLPRPPPLPSFVRDESEE